MLSCDRKIEQKDRSSSSDIHSGADTFIVRYAHYLFIQKHTQSCCKNFPLQKKKTNTQKHFYF